MPVLIDLADVLEPYPRHLPSLEPPGGR
jgi:hypothetical protein